MICVQLSGGLGNQMFQYAFGRALAVNHKTELLLDTSLLRTKELSSGPTSRSFELSLFHLNAEEARKKDIKRLKPMLYKIINSLSFRTGFKGIQTSKYFVEKEFSLNKSIDKIGKDCFLVGYWQSFKYFQDIETIIREEFQFNQGLFNKNIEVANLIKNENSVSLHIRRNDFVNNKYHDIHGTCSIEYYRKATEHIAYKVRTPFFFIFSDDIEWARSHLNLNFQCEFVSGNNGNQSYIDMQLMSLCKHNIIANSSFSWWGAWLNSNPNKVVIAPKQWFVDEKMNTQTNDLIPETWIRI